MTQDSPAKTNILQQGAIDFCNSISLRIDQDGPLHTCQNLLHMGWRCVARIGPEFEPDQVNAGFANTRTADLSSIEFVKKCLRKSVHNPTYTLGILLFLFVFFPQLFWIVNKPLNS